MSGPLPRDLFDPQCPSMVTPFQMVGRTAYEEVPPRVEYALGRSLFPATAACRTWAAEHLDELLDARAADERRSA